MSSRALFPTFAPRRGAPPTAAPPRYPPGYQWDFATGDFALDGAGRVTEADGHTTWLLWCVKAATTERYAHPIYSRQFGVEYGGRGGVMRQRSVAAGQAVFMATVTEALRLDPRTARVDGFAFAATPPAAEQPRYPGDPAAALTLHADATWATFRVEPRVGTEAHIRLLVSR